MTNGLIRAGVIGYPIGHSLSPRIHQVWIKAISLDATYDAFEVPPGELTAFVDRHRGGETLTGVNVTIPHKEQALALADTADAAARRAGAANVLLFRPDGVVEARNTDGHGLLEALSVAIQAFDPKTYRIEILGASGAARGAVAALDAAGNTDMLVSNRTVQKAQALAMAFPASVRVKPWADLEISEGVQLVINATSMGLGDTPSPRVKWPAPTGPGVALDMVYKTPMTQFLADAADSGWKTVDGVEMLIGQAAPAFEAFFGVPPPENYRALALAALKAPS